MFVAVSLCRYSLCVSFKDYLIELVELLWGKEQWKKCHLMFNHFRNWFVPGWRAAALQQDAEPCLHISTNSQAQLPQMLRFIKQNLSEMYKVTA